MIRGYGTSEKLCSLNISRGLSLSQLWIVPTHAFGGGNHYILHLSAFGKVERCRVRGLCYVSVWDTKSEE